MSRLMFGRCALAATVAFLAAGTIRAFAPIGSVWPDGNVVMQLQLGQPSSPLNDGATDWNAVAQSALEEWNTQLTHVKFTVVRDSTAAIARANRINNVIFRTDIYGQAFDSRTLAVTLGSTSTSTGASTEKDVIFNSNRTWDSYRGSLRSGITDFRRVALHEFGHVLGLDHPDQATPAQNVDAIMQSVISSAETLRPDDIAGIKAIYESATDNRTLAVGSTVPFDVPTSGTGPFTYTWYFHAPGAPYLEPFHLASTANYSIGSLQLADAGTYIATATAPNGQFFSRAVTVNVTPVNTATDTSLANISTRGVVGTGNSVLIAGFVIGGTTPKPVLVRAAGPALTGFGVGGALADPALSIVNSQSQVVAQNDNWETGGNTTAITQASTRLGAFQFKTGSRDAAILTTLPPGNYTAIVSANNATGIALVEVYDADPDAATGRTHKLLNIATRGQVDSGENVLIAGFIVTGPGPRTYLIRAVGPTLAKAPFNVTGALLDPFLQLYQGEKLLHENDDWDSPFVGQQALRDAAKQVGAFSLMETRDAATHSGLDAVMLVTLQPGSYTAKVSGFEGATGVALIEIYEMP